MMQRIWVESKAVNQKPKQVIRVYVGLRDGEDPFRGEELGMRYKVKQGCKGREN